MHCHLILYLLLFGRHLCVWSAMIAHDLDIHQMSIYVFSMDFRLENWKIHLSSVQYYKSLSYVKSQKQYVDDWTKTMSWIRHKFSIMILEGNNEWFIIACASLSFHSDKSTTKWYYLQKWEIAMLAKQWFKIVKYLKYSCFCHFLHSSK